MNYIQLMALIQFKTGKIISVTEIASKLGFSRQYVDKIKMNDVLPEHIKALELKYGMTFQNRITSADAVEIKYLEIPSLMNTIKNPDITSIWLDRELIHNKWRKNEKDLRIIQMPGDTMDNGEYSLKDGDILVIDTTVNNPQRSGIFAYTTQNNTLIFVNGLKQRPDGNVKFYYLNKTYDEVIYRPEQLKEMGFKVIGKLVKNMSID